MYRALRGLPAQTTTPTLVGPSHFARVLEAAASRAWLRRVSSQANTYPSGAAFPSSHKAISKYMESCRARGVFKNQNKIPQRHDSGSNPAGSATSTVNEASVESLASGSQAVDPLTHNTETTLADLTDPSPALSPDSEPSIILSLPSPASPQMFYDNLRFASTSKPSPAVEELTAYHDSHSHFQSPETYNICIDFAINHGRYNAANRLFDSMTKEEVYFDSTTYQLLVRLHARQFSQPELEALDRPILRKGSTSVMKMLSVIRDNDLETETEEFLRRILDCLRPMFLGWEVHPKVIKVALYSMVDRDLILAATELASAYFSSLSADIDRETELQCLDMIHLLLSVDTKGGLSAFCNNHKILIELLKSHPSLEPSSKTLFLLLSPLKKAKKCGTVAMNMAKSFQKTWGDKVVDYRVKERIIRLAKKEGRVDIVEKMTS